MDLNLKGIFLALVLTSFVQGLSAFVTPFYLTSVGVSFFDIGVVFSIATLAMVLMKIFLGSYTDVRGRKTVFASSFLLQGVSGVCFPFVRGVLDAAPIKTLYDLGISVRESLKSTIIYENARETFHKIIAWISGAEHLMMACANFFAASILSFFAFTGSYYLMAVTQFISFSIILIAYKEKVKPHKSSKVSFGDMYDLHFKRNMRALMFIGALSFIGVKLSHGFAEPLYFEAKYALSKAQIGLIIGLHRLSLAVPLFVTGAIMDRLNIKRAYCFSSLVLTFSLLAMGIVNNIYLAIPLWLLHDVFGGSIRGPSSKILVQLNARDDKRGKDANTMQLLTGLVSIATPSFTGALISIRWDLIFIVGAFLILAATIIFYIFYKESNEVLNYQTRQDNQQP